MTYLKGVKYHKYKNADPSTAKYAPVVKAEILEMIEEIINKRIKRIYNIRPEAVLGIDLRHAVKRLLLDELGKQVVEIDRFEKENSGDLRNYPWSESSTGGD